MDYTHYVAGYASCGQPSDCDRNLRLNPMYYIVKGYRNALIDHVWFWEDMGMTLYFWIVTILLFLLGSKVFMSLKPHFSDVI